MGTATSPAPVKCYASFDGVLSDRLPKVILDWWRTTCRSCAAARQRGPTNQKLLLANPIVSLHSLQQSLGALVGRAQFQGLAQQLSRFLFFTATAQQIGQRGVAADVIWILREGVAEMLDGLVVTAELDASITEVGVKLAPGWFKFIPDSRTSIASA